MRFYCTPRQQRERSRQAGAGGASEEQEKNWSLSCLQWGRQDSRVWIPAPPLTQCELLGVTLPLFGPQGSHLKNGSNDNPCSSASRSRGWPITVIRLTLSIHICCVTALWKHKKPSGPDVYYCITWLWGLRCQFQIQPYHLVAVCCWVGHILSLSLNLNISNVGSWDCCKD